MAKRIDHHKKIIADALKQFPIANKVTQFHTAQKMPRKLRGVPDLHVLREGMSWWIEIKPRYANYMRDQMSDLQFEWFHVRRDQFGEYNRYAIVEHAQELVMVVTQFAGFEVVHMGDYHQGRYETWRRGR